MKLTPMTPTDSTPALGLKVTLVIAALATAALISGCGDKSSEVASRDEGETRVAAVTQPTSQTPAVPALASASNMPSGRSGIVALGDSLPPEISASVVDSVIHPGDVIEITAET